MKRFLCLAILPMATSAFAGIIDFAGHPYDTGATIDHQGFRFSLSAGLKGVFQTGFGGFDWVDNGTTRLLAAGDVGASTARVDFKPIDDSAFSLQGFDASVLWNNFEGEIEVIGSYEGGGSISTFFDLVDDFAGYTLGSGYTNLDSVRVRTTFSGQFLREPGFQLDNINVTVAPVPEPFTMGLAGLALAAAARRRMRKSA